MQKSGGVSVATTISPDSHQLSSPGQDFEDHPHMGLAKASPRSGKMRNIMLTRFFNTRISFLPECDRDDFLLMQAGESEQAAPEFA